MSNTLARSWPTTIEWRVIAAAARLYADRPADDVTLDDIAEAIGAPVSAVQQRFDSSADLYTQVIHMIAAELLTLQDRVDRARGPDESIAERLARCISYYLDFVARFGVRWGSCLWDPVNDPPETRQARNRYRTKTRALMKSLMRLAPGNSVAVYAIDGYLGFLDAACAAWAERGCPERDRPAIVNQAIAAFEGAMYCVDPRLGPLRSSS